MKVTNSEIQTFKECRRKWWLGWYRGYRPKAAEVTGARSIGTRVHLALAEYYSHGGNPVEAVKRSVEEDCRLLEGSSKLDDLIKEGDLAEAMVEGYLQWLQETGADQGIRVTHVETKVEVPFPAFENVTLMGKLDLRAERELDGARLFIDHKTVGSISQASQRLHMNEQMLFYHLLEFLDLKTQFADTPSEEIPRTDGAIYNMLRKVKRTARANPPFYDRVEVRHSVVELRNFYLRVAAEIRDLLAVRNHLAAGGEPMDVIYPRPSADCAWKCDFFGVCPMFDDGSDAEGMLEAIYDKRNPLDRYNEEQDGD